MEGKGRSREEATLIIKMRHDGGQQQGNRSGREWDRCRDSKCFLKVERIGCSERAFIE